jgi:hypothetical protein
MKELSPQASLMLSHLNNGGTVTALHAHLTLGIADTTRCIREIRSAGVALDDEWRVDEHNRRYKAYWLSKAKED